MTDVDCAVHRRIDNDGVTVLLYLRGHFDRAGAPELRRALRPVRLALEAVGLCGRADDLDPLCVPEPQLAYP